MPTNCCYSRDVNLEERSSDGASKFGAQLHGRWCRAYTPLHGPWPHQHGRQRLGCLRRDRLRAAAPGMPSETSGAECISPVDHRFGHTPSALIQGETHSVYTGPFQSPSIILDSNVLILTYIRAVHERYI